MPFLNTYPDDLNASPRFTSSEKFKWMKRCCNQTNVAGYLFSKTLNTLLQIETNGQVGPPRLIFPETKARNSPEDKYTPLPLPFVRRGPKRNRKWWQQTRPKETRDGIQEEDQKNVMRKHSGYPRRQFADSHLHSKTVTTDLGQTENGTCHERRTILSDSILDLKNYGWLSRTRTTNDWCNSRNGVSRIK